MKKRKKINTGNVFFPDLKVRSHKKRTSLADALETVQRPRQQRRPAVSGQAGDVPVAGPGLHASGEQVVAVLVEVVWLFVGILVW